MKNKILYLINKVANFNGAKWGGKVIPKEEIKGRALDLAIPRGATQQQIEVLYKAQEYGKQVGVNINIYVIQ